MKSNDVALVQLDPQGALEHDDDRLLGEQVASDTVAGLQAQPLDRDAVRVADRGRVGAVLGDAVARGRVLIRSNS